MIPATSFYAFPLNTGQKDRGLTWWSDGYPEEDLKRIIELGEAVAKAPATVGGGAGKEVVSSITRQSQIGWIPFTKESEWLYERLVFQLRELNLKSYGFDLSGLFPLQYTVYAGAVEGGGHYDWHVDCMGASKDKADRKLSAVLQLSDPMDYEGGDLLLHGVVRQVLPKQKGLMHVFPAYTPHRVTPVTKGVRKTLVVWVVGPDFR